MAVFGFSTYLAYEHDRDEDNAYITTIFAGSITGLFHLGNILGAHRTVRYRNARDRNYFLKPVREAALDLDY
ncbi:MAG: hypothetical protein JSW58_16170 [Candidatus Latescibacterota bacterium]|nr:MAG: hypothetical protein JSW58_16170 [Candidatus Latescibacterota bacterium]